MTQEYQILNHLMTRGAITPMDALNDYGCFRLAARVNHLRKEGWKIESCIEHRNEKRYAKYFLTH